MDTDLTFDADVMRALGYRVIDDIVARIDGLGDGPAWRGAEPAELAPRLVRPPPEHPATDPQEAFAAALDRLHADVLAYGVRVDHPRFFAFVPGAPTWPGVLGDAIAAGYDVFAGTWLGSAGSAQLELAVLDWFRSWLGLPAGASGILTSGGSAANLAAMVAARDARLGPDWRDGTAYMSAEAHSSVRRAARILGFADDRVRLVPMDAGLRMDAGALREAIARDRDAGLRPFFVVGSAGATGTGAIDPLPDLADIASEQELWFHIDAAYGGFAVLTERGATALRGIDRADSVTLDPHKWLFQPFEVGCLMVRDPETLRRAFHVSPDYLEDAAARGGAVNFADRGLQLTRAARAIKIWLTVETFGVAAIRRAIDRTLDLTEAAEAAIRASRRLEVVTPASLGIVVFRRRPEDAGAGAAGEDADELNRRLIEALRTDGLGMVSSTRVNGRYVIRLCILNHRTTEDDVRRVVEWLDRWDG
ncbi:MAG TPA: aminotransferase class I/II-fold pyridoxal phosphate-dependent enzyme [Longimicrobiales bacterium]|nr:aminotransferase class I/II-fold pyridoxal phosphate-dependent enzyme [Longimicrobiales bacterium]